MLRGYAPPPARFPADRRDAGGHGTAAPLAHGSDATVEMTATGTFEVQLIPAAQADTGIAMMTIAKTFGGDLAGTSAGTMLAVRTDVAGSAGYVAMERVAATLAGRHGTFALQHGGTMERGTPTLSVTVVPDSGTGDLAGLAGAMEIQVADGRHSYVFRYTLPR